MGQNIIYARPQTDRASAFNKSIDDATAAVVSGFKKKETDRQRAFNQAMKMREAGYDVAPEEVEQAMGTGSEEGQFSKLFNQRTPEFEAAQERQRQAEMDAQIRREEAETRQYNLDQERLQDKEYRREQDRKKMEWEQKKFGTQQEQKRAALERKESPSASPQFSEKEKRELGVTGYGIARTRGEAQKMRKAIRDKDDAVSLIDEIQELGTDVNLLDVGRQQKIKQKLSLLAGKLREPILGPGIMTETEFNRLISNMGDPSKLFSTEALEKKKLSDVKNMLIEGVDNWAKSSIYSPEGQAPQQYADNNLIQSDMNIPYAPINAPGMMPEAQAAQNEMILTPERTQIRQSRIQELRAKAARGQ